MANIFSRLIRSEKQLTNTKTKSFGGVGSMSYGVGATMNCYRYGSYDNTFPNITRISEAFAEVLPYAVDINGDRIKQQPRLISALYNPNKQMSGVDFFETLIVMTLVHSKAYILCWHEEKKQAIAGGVITPENICGFTFLENPRVEYDNTTGIKTYTISTKSGEEKYTESEVIELSLNVNPYSLVDGYSPSMASKKWSNIDDAIADFQNGFFQNGAVPAGEFIITASSASEYEEIVDELQRKHRGAGANNNVVYVHKPIDTITGTPMNAQIEWVPFAQANKDMTLQALFDQANKKIDMDFGVPQEVKGYLQNSNYASVEVADYIFARRVVYPKLVKIWSKFTHEMNRITGGLGFAISFDYEMPVLVETRKNQIETLLLATNAGYTLDSAVDALQLPKSFLKLARETQNMPQEERPDIENDNDMADADQMASSGLKTLKKKDITPDPKVQSAVEDYTAEQIAAAQNEEDFDEKKKSEEFKKKLLIALLFMLDEYGNLAYNEFIPELEEAGYDTEDLKGFTVPEEVVTTYDKYLSEVALSYTQDTNASIKKVLEKAEAEKWSRTQLNAELGKIMTTDKWRIERISKTETHRAEQMARLTAMRELAKETGAVIYKQWNVNPMTSNPCETCLALDGVQLPLGEDFGDFRAGVDNVADAHPNCSCYLTFVIVENKKSVKVQCPSCKRFLCESTGGNIQGIKCQGCKKHFEFDIKNGEVKAKEIK